MYITFEQAQEFVRSRIDELSQVESDLLVSTIDDRNLNLTVAKHLPEAIIRVHLDAPVLMVEESVKLEPGNRSVSVKIDKTTGVADISIPGVDVLRLVRLQASDSPFIITSPVPEDSPVGRMQLDEFVRGRWDSPILVQQQDSLGTHPHYKYYSLASGESGATFTIGVFERPKEIEGKGFFVSAALHESVLNYLTGMVLQAYRASDQAQYYFALTK